MRRWMLAGCVMIWNGCAFADSGQGPAPAPVSTGSGTSLIDSLPRETNSTAETPPAANPPAGETEDWRGYLTGRWQMNTQQENMRTVVLTFDGDEFKAEAFRINATQPAFLTIVGHYKATQIATNPSKARVIYELADWSPKKICNADRCMSVPTPKLPADVFEKVDDLTMQAENGRVLQRLP